MQKNRNISLYRFEFIKIIVKIVLTLLVYNLFADFSRFDLERL